METKRPNVNGASDDEGTECKDCDETSCNLPEPSVVLFPRERIQLGWRNEEASSAGSRLVNTGMICYINSTLQALFHIPAFTNWLMNDDEHGKACLQMTESSGYDCMVCMVKETFWLSQVYTGSSFWASYITDRLPQICKHLSTRRQEDAHEFLCYLIESMDRSYLHVLGYADKSLDPYSKETTPVNQIFSGYTRTEVTCEECGHRSTTFQHFRDLILDIDRSDTVRDALRNYFESEQLSYVCDGCRKDVLATKKFSIEKAPNVLCVQLKRYDLIDESDDSKNNKVIQIDERMDLSDCVFGTDAPPAGYHLVSMVKHYGRSLDEGHYTAVGLTSFGSYYNFNDTIVHETSFDEQSQSKNLYLIFYELDPLEVAKDAGSENEPTITKTEPLRQVPEEDGSKVESSVDITTNGSDDEDLTVSTPAVAGTSYSSDQKMSRRSPIERLSAEERAILLPQGHPVPIDGVETGSDARKDFVYRTSPAKRSFEYDHDDDIYDRIVKKKKFDNRQTEDNNVRLRSENRYEWITETGEYTTKKTFKIPKMYNENESIDHGACGDGRQRILKRSSSLTLSIARALCRCISYTMVRSISVIVKCFHERGKAVRVITLTTSAVGTDLTNRLTTER